MTQTARQRSRSHEHIFFTSSESFNSVIIGTNADNDDICIPLNSSIPRSYHLWALWSEDGTSPRSFQQIRCNSRKSVTTTLEVIRVRTSRKKKWFRRFLRPNLRAVTGCSAAPQLNKATDHEELIRWLYEFLKMSKMTFVIVELEEASIWKEFEALPSNSQFD